MTLAAALSSVVIHTADPGYAYVSGLESYLPAGSVWQVPDFSAYVPGYAFAQVQDSTPPVFVSSNLNLDTGVLSITFSEDIDVTPATNVVPFKIHVRESGTYTGGVTLTVDELDTNADGAIISFILTASHNATLADLTAPKLTVEPGAVRDTAGNPIVGTFDVSTASFVDATSVSDQEIFPQGMAFSNDGTKMFVVGYGNNAVNEYTLSAPWDASTATFVDATSVREQVGNSIGMAFSSNGTKMFVVDWNLDDINEYTLTSPWDASTATFVDATSISDQETDPTGMAFSNDGTKMFVIGIGGDINEYTLTSPWDASTATWIDAFGVSRQETAPQGMVFSADGTKMFVVGNAGDDINEYTLTSPWDASTAEFVDAFDVSGQDAIPQGMAFSADGTKMFVVGNAGDDINEYTLSSVYDVTVNNVPVANQSPTVSITGAATINEGASGTLTGDASDSDGRISTYEWRVDDTTVITITSGNTATLQYDTSQVSSDTTVTFTLIVTDDDGAEASDTYDVTVNNVPVANQSPTVSITGAATINEGASGTLTGDASDSDGRISTYEWRVDDASVVTITSGNTATLQYDTSQVSSDTTVTFTLIVTDDDGAEASDTYDVTVNNVSAPDTPPVFVSSELDIVTGVLSITFSDDIDVTPATNVVASKIHIRESGNYTGGGVTLTASELDTGADGTTISFTLIASHRTTVVGLSTPELTMEPGAVRDTAGNPIVGTFDVSTASFVDALDVSEQGTSPSGIAFSGDSRDMFVVEWSEREINHYDLDTPWDVSTAYFVDAFNVTEQEVDPRGIAFSSNGTKMFVVGTAGDDINEYDLDTPWEVSTATWVDAFDVMLQETSPQGMAFSDDGTKMFVVGVHRDNVNEYDLTSPWDASTATFVDAFDVEDQDRSPTGMAFSSDGTKMFVVGDAGDDINEYTLSSPWDASTADFVGAFDVSAQETSPQGMAFSSDGTKMFVVGDAGDDINEYTLSSVYPITTASGLVPDTTPPRVTSILRDTLGVESTTATTLVFAVTFNEPVTNVDTADFVLTGTGTGTISTVSGSGASYRVTVTVTTVGTIGLDIASGHDIQDTATNGLTDRRPIVSDETYTIVETTEPDTTPPRVTSILRDTPGAESTTATALVFAVTFNEPVTNVDTADFVLTGTGTGTISTVSGSGASYRVTVTVTASGTIGLDIASGHDIQDTATNGLTDLTPIVSDETYAVNRLPVLDNIPSQTVNELVLLTFIAEANDPDNNDTLEYSLIGTTIPEGAAMDSGTGLFSWTPTEAQDGTHTITVQVSDGNRGSDSETVTITVREVNVDPVLNPIISQNVDELDLLTFTATATDEDLVGGTANTLTFSLTDNPPRGAAITPGGVFTWTPDQSQDGDHTITVQVSDGRGGGTDSETVNVTVIDIEPMPVSAQSTGSSITLTLSEIVTSSGTGPNGFSVQHDGDPISVDSITGSGTNTLVLELSGSISAPAKISYDGSGDVTDEDGKLLAVFSDRDVSFPSKRSGSTSSPPSVDTLEINGQSYGVKNRINHNATPLEVAVDQPILLNFMAHDRLDILYFAVYLNLQDDDMSYTNSDTYVEYNRGQTNIVDPNNLLSDASLVISPDPDDYTKKTVTLDITFAEAIGNTNMVVRTWNADRQSSIVIIVNALHIIPSKVDPEPRATTEADSEPQVAEADPEPQVAEADPEPRSSTIPDNPEPVIETFDDDSDHGRALYVLRAWSGFESEVADDGQLLDVMGLSHLGADIPAWVMTDLAPLVVKERITMDEFRVALEYVMRNA